MPIRRNPRLTHHRRRFSERPAALRAFRPRSEVVGATRTNADGTAVDSMSYAFDDIGNRLTAEELAAETEYASNNLNQYSQIAKEGEAAFPPTYDDDGNQTLVKTSTGIWSVEYNGENRPVKFANGTTVVECKYDSQGRRYEKKVAVDGVTTFWQRYAYRNYLQIAAFDVSVNPDANEEVLTLATTTAWDPAEPQATRPLAFTDHGGDAPATYFHTHDLTKNVCELLNATGAIVAAYDYAPFGAVALSGTSTRNPFQFSSEVHDPETALVYYNYRHYNPLDGRWISRDFIGEDTSFNLYLFLANQANNVFDRLGNARYYETGPRLFIQGVVATPASSTLPDMVSGLELATLSLRNLINMSHIISEINKCLSEAGWGICQCCCLIMLRCVLNYDQKYTIVKSTSFLEHMSCEDAWEYERGQTIREYIPHLENIDVRIPIYCKKQA